MFIDKSPKYVILFILYNVTEGVSTISRFASLTAHSIGP